MPTRRLLALTGAVLLLGGSWLGSGEPRLTALNDALLIHYPAPRAAGTLAAALGVALLAAAAPRRWLRIAAAALALAGLGIAAHLLLFRLELSPSALLSAGLLSRTEIPWSEVTRVETGPAGLVVFASGEPRLRIPTGALTPDQRATLERGIARRVREADRPAP